MSQFVGPIVGAGDLHRQLHCAGARPDLEADPVAEGVADDHRPTADAWHPGGGGDCNAGRQEDDALVAGAELEHRQEIAILEAQVAQAEAALVLVESSLAKATLVAPFAGTVGAVHLREGEVVSPSTQVLVLGDVSTLRVETTDLNEVDVARVKVGSPVTLTFDALPERVTKGEVIRIAPMASVSQGGTNFTTVIEMSSPAEELRWGMTAFVDIEVDR